MTGGDEPKAVPRWRRRWFWEVVAGMMISGGGFAVYSSSTFTLKTAAHSCEIMGFIFIVAGIAEKKYLERRLLMKKIDNTN